jgi:hypothetical protein
MRRRIRITRKRNISKRSARNLPKVCNSCGHANPINVSKCKDCGKARFAPSWVLAKRPINRQVGVEITQSNPTYGAQTERITLTKWWPGGNTSFHIPTPAQWEKIQSIINEDLGPILGWESAKEVIERIKSAKGPASAKDYRQVAQQHPQLLKELASAIDLKKLAESDFEQVLESFGQLSDALNSANAGFRDALLSLLKKLPTQRQRALEELDALLQGWSLQVVTSVAQQVKLRLDLITLFERQIQDDRTLEISGSNSIHRILERAMWLIDERYWLLQSNEPLRNFIGKEMSKLDKKRYGKKRPDFVCGTVDQKLIILELKRPSHKLTIEDLNQLETYVTVAEDYSTFRSYEAYLVGRKVDPELKRRMKHRSSAFKVVTYSDIIEDTRKRYSEFLKSLEI